MISAFQPRCDQIAVKRAEQLSDRFPAPSRYRTHLDRQLTYPASLEFQGGKTNSLFVNLYYEPVPRRGVTKRRLVTPSSRDVIGHAAGKACID